MFNTNHRVIQNILILLENPEGLPIPLGYHPSKTTDYLLENTNIKSLLALTPVSIHF